MSVRAIPRKGLKRKGYVRKKEKVLGVKKKRVKKDKGYVKQLIYSCGIFLLLEFLWDFSATK